MGRLQISPVVTLTSRPALEFGYCEEGKGMATDKLVGSRLDAGLSYCRRDTSFLLYRREILADICLARKLNYLEAEISVEDVFHSCKTASISLLTGLEVFEATVTGRCSHGTAASSWISTPAKRSGTCSLIRW
jgi:hypothetical protein